VTQISFLVEEFGFYDLVPRNSISGPFMGHLCKLAPHLCIKLQEGFWDWDGKIDNSKDSIMDPKGTLRSTTMEPLQNMT